MILVLAGTGDGRLLVGQLVAEGHRVLASSLTEYGGRLLEQEGACQVRTGALAQDGLAALIRQYGVRAIVDATHPYAERISVEAQEACRQAGIPYLRHRREETALPEHPLIHQVNNWEEAAGTALSLGETVMLTIGTRHLEPFVTAARERRARGRQTRLIARMLPEEDSIVQCRRLGFCPGDIVALQGPVSHQLNVALFRHYGVKAVVTKNSGPTGGTDAKVSACLELGVHLVVVNRFPVDQAAMGLTGAEILNLLRGV
ncbi:hypothetical protein SY88_00580 [Clostridiales bacterium PH28_bin88]|nr:hypothetical protein SY88_00580 [Clostridiales bacterium PH28_bin88]